MVFSSPIFLFYFLPLCLVGYYLTPVRGRNAFLTLASYVFYGWWHAWFVLLMIFSTCVDYACGRMISAPGASERRRRTGVAISVVVNLALLGFFKYGVFTQENVAWLSEQLGGPSFRVVQIMLPLGISFYTFQSMSYSIDIYRRQAKPATSLIDFSCYVSMFPQLVAGPIVRYRELAEQLDERPQRGEQFARGALTFCIGFAKKVLLANTMGACADVAYDSHALEGHTAWFGIWAYAFQVYFDFSGYSDMAIGLGHMFGFKLPLNFASPYRSKSVTELWTRWHISLSSWLRDYLYIPLGGNRKGRVRTYVNLWTTMVLGGFWHGAEWQLIVFGACHGTALALERLLGKRATYAVLPGALRNILTMIFFALTTVFFRSEDLGHALRYLGAAFGAAEGGPVAALVAGRMYSPFFVTAFAACVLIIWFGRETKDLVRWLETSVAASLACLALFVGSVVVMFAQAEDPFIYFRF